MNTNESLEQKTFFFLKQFNLTDREITVAKAIVDLKTNKEIASILFIAVGTVEKHNTHIFRKTGTKNRAAFIKYLYANGLQKMDE